MEYPADDPDRFPDRFPERLSLLLVLPSFARALETWPRDGVPRTPAAWLTTTARNIAMDAPYR